APAGSPAAATTTPAGPRARVIPRAPQRSSGGQRGVERQQSDLRWVVGPMDAKAKPGGSTDCRQPILLRLQPPGIFRANALHPRHQRIGLALQATKPDAAAIRQVGLRWIQ